MTHLHFRSCLVCVTILCVFSRTIAQRSAAAGTSNAVYDAHACDSLGDYYLFNSDTSMAIYYYQKYVDLKPGDAAKEASLRKLRNMYIKNNQSFYLREY